MVENYSFTLKNNKTKLLKRVTWIWYFALLSIIAIFIFSDIGVEGVIKKNLIKAFVLYIAIGVYYFIRKEKNAFKGFIIVVFLISLPCIYNFFGVYFAICFVLFSMFIYFFTQQKTNISFNNENIVIKNGFFRRIIEWNNLNNTVLKDGVLTLDFKNDKLIQEEVEGEIVNEKDFTTFLKNKFQ
jgi:hypothetical protein